SAQASDADGTVRFVEFLDGTNLLVRLTNTPYSFTWSNAAPGSHSMMARAADNWTGTNQTTITIVVSNRPPQVALTQPTNNQVFFKGTNVTLLATASDLDGVVTRVEFFASTNKIGEVSNAPFTLVWSNVPFGAVALTAKATDDSAAVTTSGAVNVQVVSNQLPTISFVSPTNGQSFLRPTNILLSAQASDADGTVRFVEFLDGTNLLVRLTNTPYSFTWSNVVLGSHSLMARAADNWTGTNQTMITIAVSNRPPQVALHQPTNTQVFFAGTNVTLLATASDLDGVVTRVEFYEGANKIGED